jgi:hypothetical protein
MYAQLDAAQPIEGQAAQLHREIDRICSADDGNGSLGLF